MTQDNTKIRFKDLSLFLKIAIIYLCLKGLLDITYIIVFTILYYGSI